MEYKGVMVFAEQKDSGIHPISFELLGKGREIADKLGVSLSSVLLGYQIKDEAINLIYYGADKVFLYDHPSLKDFDVMGYKRNIVNLVGEEKPEILLVGATHLGRSLAPRIATGLGTGLTADCTDLSLDVDGNLIQIRPAFTGNILAYIKTRTRPQMSTVRYKVMEMRERDASRSGEIIEKEVEVTDGARVKIVREERGKEVDIADADVIVSGGRGLKKPEDFSIIKQLANALDGIVGSSRPLVDAGWIGKEHQVGFSGNTVKPRLYVACGISGSPQHLAGMRNSDTIVAINTDPLAPIFKFSDYGIVGDLYEVIPKLVNQINHRKSTS